MCGCLHPPRWLSSVLRYPTAEPVTAHSTPAGGQQLAIIKPTVNVGLVVIHTLRPFLLSVTVTVTTAPAVIRWWSSSSTTVCGEVRRWGKEEEREGGEGKIGKEKWEGGGGKKEEREREHNTVPTKSSLTSPPHLPPHLLHLTSSPSPCVSAQTSTCGKVAQTARRSRYSSSESLRTSSRRSVSFIAANCSMVVMLRWRKEESCQDSS